jgi:hypothetical protein
VVSKNRGAQIPSWGYMGSQDSENGLEKKADSLLIQAQIEQLKKEKEEAEKLLSENNVKLLLWAAAYEEPQSYHP